jgi:uncharacterized YigZ family protein
MVTVYKTIKSASEGLYKEKGSKFIAIAVSVTSIADVEAQLTVIRKKYHDARHHCYAYVINPDADVYRTNDDGEPNHSAGDPILGQIRSFGLTNTLIIVVRYFGGTKLGVSGLINAYKSSAKNALNNSTILTQKVTKHLTLTFPYQSTNDVMKLVSEVGLKIGSQKFDTNCIIEGELPILNFETLESKIDLLNKLGVEIALIV